MTTNTMPDKSVMITMRVPDQKLKRIDRAAKEIGLSRTKFLTRCAMNEAKEILNSGWKEC